MTTVSKLIWKARICSHFAFHAHKHAFLQECILPIDSCFCTTVQVSGSHTWPWGTLYMLIFVTANLLLN
uniref:Uncharacterized protein n=1 Tax=Anguilla anguilla TaxID=7936 RepID=A0A0E9Y1B6_ANGAN